MILSTFVLNDIFKNFFSFFQNFDLQSCWKGKSAKNGLKWPTILLCFISQEPHIIWLSFMVIRLCEMISPGVFSVFQNFDFLGRQGGGERAKNCPNRQNILSVKPYISGTIYDLHLWYTCMYKRIIAPGILFSSFQNSDFRGH